MHVKGLFEKLSKSDERRGSVGAGASAALAVPCHAQVQVFLLAQVVLVIGLNVRMLFVAVGLGTSALNYTSRHKVSCGTDECHACGNDAQQAKRLPAWEDARHPRLTGFTFCLR